MAGHDAEIVVKEDDHTVILFFYYLCKTKHKFIVDSGVLAVRPASLSFYPQKRPFSAISVILIE